MTPMDRILTEGDITWRLDRGWRIVEADGSLWWYPPTRFRRVPPMALTEAETAVWTARPKENP